jgi:hypothetical protein
MNCKKRDRLAGFAWTTHGLPLDLVGVEKVQRNIQRIQADYEHFDLGSSAVKLRIQLAPLFDQAGQCVWTFHPSSLVDDRTKSARIRMAFAP